MLIIESSMPAERTRRSGNTAPQSTHRHIQRTQRSMPTPYRSHSRSSLLTLTTAALAGLLSLLASGGHNASAYNIDLPSYRMFSNTPGSMFGFSIAMFNARSRDALDNSLVVGAPNFHRDGYTQRVDQSGAVFKCGMKEKHCYLVPMDSKNITLKSNMPIEDKSNQFFGATVSTGRNSDIIVACAPRYKIKEWIKRILTRYEPVGSCYVSRNFVDYQEVSPCRTRNLGYHGQGYCEAGFSAAVTSNGSRLFIGAPGSWYWQGQVYSVSPRSRFPYTPQVEISKNREALRQDGVYTDSNDYYTKESSQVEDDTYLGYSMITGNFDNDRIEDAAVGRPRGAGLLGMVLVYRYDMTNIFNKTGTQIGEYFGYALATSDVDGDGLDDLIIGAPLYSELSNQDGSYDVGRVYVLLQRGPTYDKSWSLEFLLDGFDSKGRFGLALTTLGDINSDNYGDFAVGAPYAGVNGNGIVYIYHGSAKGPLNKPTQIIHAEDVIEMRQPPRTFGFSLAGGLDMDGNTYPDLAVGAYESDQVFIFKSRPIAMVKATINFNNPNKLINLEEHNCPRFRNAACTVIKTCLSYGGYNLQNSLDFNVSWLLDAKKPNSPRMYFESDQTYSRNQIMRLTDGHEPICLSDTIYLVDKVQDKLTPLEVEVRYNLFSNRRNRNRSDELEPVIVPHGEIVIRDAINILKNCGPDNICVPDLQLNIKTVKKYLFGSPEPLTIEVIISNMNGDAFEAAFYMVMPKDLHYKRLQPIDDKGDAPITCSVISESNSNVLKCDIGNPLQGKKVVHFNVEMTQSEELELGTSSSYDFYMEVNSTNRESNETFSNNVIEKSIGIWVDTDLVIEGNSLPANQLYNAADYKAIENATSENELGPQIVHIYNIRNNRPSAIEEAVVNIYYPAETLAGEPLIYLTNQLETSGNILCEPHMVNTRNLLLDQALVRKSFLGSGSIHSSQLYGTNSFKHTEKSVYSHKKSIADNSSIAAKESTKQRNSEAKPSQDLNAAHQIDFNQKCQKVKCQMLQCTVRDLIRDNGAWIAIRTRLVVDTLEKIASNMPVNISIMAEAQVTRLPLIGAPKDNIIKTYEIYFKVEPDRIPVPNLPPLAIFLPAFIGAIILLLLTYTLYKCDFFKRNRPMDNSMER